MVGVIEIIIIVYLSIATMYGVCAILYLACNYEHTDWLGFKTNMDMPGLTLMVFEVLFYAVVQAIGWPVILIYAAHRKYKGD